MHLFSNFSIQILLHFTQGKADEWKVKNNKNFSQVVYCPFVVPANTRNTTNCEFMRQTVVRSLVEIASKKQKQTIQE